MLMHRRDFIKYGIGTAGSLLLPAPLLAAPSLDCPDITHPHPERRLYTEKELRNIKVTLHANSGPRHKNLNLVEQGLRKHGITATYAKRNARLDSDVAVCWSFHQRRMHRFRHPRGLHTLFMERGFFQPRRKWISLSWEGITNCGQYAPTQGGGERWDEHFSHHLKPWKEGTSGHILLLGQKPKDSALYGLDMLPWLDEMAGKLSAHNKPIVFRPHPRVRKKYHRKENPLSPPPGTTLSTNRDLEKDLAGAAFSVAYSSTAAVESVLAGVPCVTFHKGAIARPVTSRDIQQPYYRPDRTPWCHETAWKQWSNAEIANGDAWEHLKQYLLV